MVGATIETPEVDPSWTVTAGERVERETLLSSRNGVPETTAENATRTAPVTGSTAREGAEALAPAASPETANGALHSLPPGARLDT